MKLNNEQYTEIKHVEECIFSSVLTAHNFSFNFVHQQFTQ